jgi:hypothetical protein
MCLTCVRTVAGLTFRVSATCEVVAPSTSRSATSHSRWVSELRTGLNRLILPRPSLAASLRRRLQKALVTAASPLHTPRRTRGRTARSIDLRSQPLAPARNARI